MADMGSAVAVVTGSTRGLGRAIATQLADAGARVVLVGRSTADSPHALLPGTLDEVAADLRDRGADVLAVRANLNRHEDAQEVVDRTLEWAGRCDVLVANASYTPAGSFFEVPASRWTTGWNITVLSTVVLLQGFLPGMLERGSGRVLAIGSGAAAYEVDVADGWQPRADGYGPPLLYAVTKSALERLFRGMHDDFGGRGVSFVNLRSGQITTESWHLMSSQMGMGGNAEMHHAPDEVASAALWLLDRGDEVSGLIVDFEWLQARGALVVK